MGPAVVIATRHSIRVLAALRRRYGGKRWRKMKAEAEIRLPNGVRCRAELHWYEAHGIGRRDMKIKHLL